MGTSEDRTTADQAGTPATAATNEATGALKAAMRSDAHSFVEAILAFLAEPSSAETQPATILSTPIPSRRVRSSCR